MIKKLECFQKTFGSTYNESPCNISKEDYELRYKLLKEENEEYLEACQNNDMVEILDALTDKLFLVLGSFVSHGMQHLLEPALDEVFMSNMSKLGNDGKPLINLEGSKYFDPRKPIGKILKNPETYFEPNLKQFLCDTTATK